MGNINRKSLYLLETTFVHPIGGQAGGLNSRWRVDHWRSIGVEGHSASASTHFGGITGARIVTVTLVRCNGASIVDFVIAKALNTVFHASDLVSEAGAGLHAPLLG
jgi:hypothetical protein